MTDLSGLGAIASQLCRLCCAWLLLSPLVSCGQAPAAPTAAVGQTDSLPALHTRPEQEVPAPCGALWAEGQETTLRGLYRTAGDQIYLDVFHLLPDSPPCWARFFLDRDLGLEPVPWESPHYVEVVGQPFSGRWWTAGLWDLQVTRWQVLALDVEAVRLSCRQAVAAQIDALQALDWAALSTPSYMSGTVGFRPAAEDLLNVLVHLEGADDGRPLLVLSAQGPPLPTVHPLVHRWVAFECVYDVSAERVVELVATIRGEVQE